MDDFKKCCCRHCEGHIEFPAEINRTTVACPHCGRETVLFASSDTPKPAVDEYLGHKFSDGKCVYCLAKEKTIRDFRVRCQKFESEADGVERKTPVTSENKSPSPTAQIPATPPQKLSNLMPCPDCGREVSKNAHSCPQCGRVINTHTSSQSSASPTPLPVQETSQTATGLLAAIILGLIIGGFMMKGCGAL